jgi:hypothetical protein
MRLVYGIVALVIISGASFGAIGAELSCEDHATQKNIIQLVKQLRVRSASGLSDVEPGGAFTDVFQFANISAAKSKLVCSAFVTAQFKTMAISYRARVTYKEGANGQKSVSVAVGK